MGIRKRFNENFGVEDGIEAERKRFVERANQVIFHSIDTVQPDMFDYDNLFKLVCYELGTNAYDLPASHTGLHQFVTPDLVALTNGDFNETLRVLCALYEHISFARDKQKGRLLLSKMIEDILARCTCDIGIRWKDDFFYRSGAEELDKPLIEDVLIWLKDYPDEEKDYRAALRHYSAGDFLRDAVDNCYSAVEGIARRILGNTTRLDKNVKALVAQIGLSQGWEEVLTDYVKYAHHYRHADPVRHDITKQEAEAYLYMTGLIIRLAVETKKS